MLSSYKPLTAWLLLTDSHAEKTMKPTIALVGRPNVGKSTLFNKLTRTQDALVADMPGLTRDRQYGDGKVGGWPYLLVDTGGLSGAPDSLDAAMADQTLCAVREADLVVFMVDGRSGIVSVDEEIADILRRQARHVVLCVNKIDGIGEDKAQLDFHQLGFDHMVAIAASHNRGVQQLVEELADFFEIPEDERIELSRKRRSRKSKVAEKSAEPGVDGASVAGAERGFGPGYEPVEQSEIRITFVGRPNVGKSTLINRLLGEDRVIAYDQPGTTRDSVSIPFERAGRKYSLIDTAGVRRRGKVSEKVEIFSIIKTLQSIDKSNVCVMLLDGNRRYHRPGSVVARLYHRQGSRSDRGSQQMGQPERETTRSDARGSGAACRVSQVHANPFHQCLAGIRRWRLVQVCQQGLCIRLHRHVHAPAYPDAGDSHHAASAADGQWATHQAALRASRWSESTDHRHTWQAGVEGAAELSALPDESFYQGAESVRHTLAHRVSSGR